MIFRTWTPPFPLNQFVERFWYHRGYSPEHSKEKLLPDGTIEIIIDLQDDPKRIFDGADFSRWESLAKGWISGQHREFIARHPPRPTQAPRRQVLEHLRTFSARVSFHTFTAHPTKSGCCGWDNDRISNITHHISPFDRFRPSTMVRIRKRQCWIP